MRTKETSARIHDAFSHLVISVHVLDQLGPAINSRHSLFIYGPPGNGKTVISQAIRNLLRGKMDIPYALAVDTEIIRLYDSLNHEALAEEVVFASLEREASSDGRW